MIAKGAKVRQIVPVIEGEVTERRFDDSEGGHGEMEFHVEYVDATGEPSARWFKESDLEVTAEPEAKKEDSATSGDAE